ncbi:MAG: S8 family serine peptidase [Chloroflexi bacterium]|nr:S8 family serine peptidase [Chloroflexota bacterium]
MDTFDLRRARPKRSILRSGLAIATLALLAVTALPAAASDSKGAVHSSWVPAVLDPARQTTVVVELGGSPVAVHEAGALARGRRLSELSQTVIRAGLRDRQEALLPSLTAIGARILGQYQDAYDGIKVRVAARDLARIRALPGVVRVVPVPVYRLANVASDTYTGVPAAWAAAGGLTGRGVRIGIVDTGIDYYHADFGGSGLPADFSADDGTTIGTSAFPNAKVAGGFDFVGDDYDAGGTGAAVIPHPDPDPLDCDGHGTHTAATAAGLGVLSGGATFHGPYNAKTLSAQHFQIGPGTAPEASLYALRVFGCAGTTDMVVDAIDWAVKNHLNVLSLSLGSPFGNPGSADSVAADNASKAGVVLVAAAGNEGPGAYVNSEPGAASRSIEVAAVDAIPSFPGATIAVGAGLSAIVANEATTLPVTGRLDVLPGTDGAIGLGCSADDYAGVAAGDIVVTLRGDCPRVDRATLGQAAGAAAVIMVNNGEKDAFPPLEGTIKDVTVPFLGVKPSGAAALQAAAGTTVTISGGITLPNPTFRASADFSSGGPAGDGSLKPDVAAPGLSVFSAAVGTGTGGIRESGTSMSTPHVAGIVALVRQAHPGWTPEQVKAAIMNTASAGAVAGYDPRIAGSGLVQPAAAVSTVAIATTGPGLASLSFGAPALDAAYTATKTIRIQNTGRTPITYGLKATFSGSSLGAHLTITPSTVTVAAGRTVSVAVRLSLTAAAVASLPSADSPVDKAGGLTSIGGAVVATPTAKAAGRYALRVPFLLVPRALSRITAPSTVGLARDAVTNRQTGTATLVNTGIRTGAADVFAWGLRGGSLNAGSVDLRAVGVQSLTAGPDGIAVPPNDRLLVFAINTWQGWSSPATNEFDILVNPDSTGQPAYVIGALDHGIATSGTPDGIEGCFVLRVADDTIADATFTKAPANGSTVRCGVLASAIGVVGGGAFSYAAASASLVSPTTVQLAGLASFNPFSPALSQGDHFALGPGKSTSVPLWIEGSAFAAVPSPLGWMIVSPDDAAGPEQVATIPAVAAP